MSQPGHGFGGGAVVGAPGEDGQRRAGVAGRGDVPQIPGQALELGQALVMHFDPHDQVLGEMAVRGVFVRVGHHYLRPEARNKPGGDPLSGYGIALVLVTRGTPGKFRGDCHSREVPGRAGELGVGKILVGEDKHRRLVFFSQVQSFGAQQVPLERGAGGQNRPGKSSWPACSTKARSPWEVRVGSPVLGPGRWETTTTSGVSLMAASPTPSVIRQKPPPAVPVRARAPA